MPANGNKTFQVFYRYTREDKKWRLHEDVAVGSDLDGAREFWEEEHPEFSSENLRFHPIEMTSSARRKVLVKQSQAKRQAAKKIEPFVRPELYEPAEQLRLC